MTGAHRLGLLLALVLPLVVAPEASAAPYAPIPTCSPGPADCSGWHTSNVTISWQYEGGWTAINCNSLPITTDTNAAQRTCAVAYDPEGVNWFSRTVTIRRDATPPQVTSATFERAPDSDGWYNHPVAVVFAGTDAGSGIASCERPTYGGGDSPAAGVSGTCRDVAGNTSAPLAAALKYDATPPVVSAEPDRKPDGNGWYRRPVTVTFGGGDATSGVESCSPPARYAGPDNAEASLAGTCRDRAGNAAAPVAFALKYDATPPKLATATARFASGVARVEWAKPADAVLVRIDRIPGVNGARRTNVYKGTGGRFVDRTVRKGVRYRYELSVADAAGNVTTKALTTTARPPLYAPAAGAVVRGPVSLAWEPAAGARFYNVQLFRNGVKVLTTWPKATRVRVPARWRFGGKAQALVAGRYRWVVWPALGTAERPRYGRPLGSSTFRVR